MTADPSITQALDTLRQRRKELDDAIHALERVIGVAQTPTKPPASAKSEPPLRALTQRRGSRTDLAEAIITERPGHGLTPKELADALAERGVPIRSEHQARAARAVGDRVRERNPAVKLQDGRFVYQPAGTNGSVRPEGFHLPTPNSEATA